MTTPSPETLRVTVDNFIRAESDLYFGMFVDRGALGTFVHRRELPLENTGVRPNRDTLYSMAVFDLDAAPVTITLPDAGERFMSLMLTDQDHYVVDVIYRPGGYTWTRQDVGTRYVLATARILIEPDDPADIARVHALQDAILVHQQHFGTFEVPAWDKDSQKTVRDALTVLGSTLPDLRHGGGNRGAVDPVRHLIATGVGWGLHPDQDAIYLNVRPDHNDAATVYRLHVPTDIPVDAFWSVTVYDADGRFRKNDLDAYSINSITARRDPDGSITVQFGGCDATTPNCLPIMPGWNYMVRLYRPRQDILDGTFSFPQARPA